MWSRAEVAFCLAVAWVLWGCGDCPDDLTYVTGVCRRAEHWVEVDTANGGLKAIGAESDAAARVSTALYHDYEPPYLALVILELGPFDAPGVELCEKLTGHVTCRYAYAVVQTSWKELQEGEPKKVDLKGLTFGALLLTESEDIAKELGNPQERHGLGPYNEEYAHYLAEGTITMKYYGSNKRSITFDFLFRPNPKYEEELKEAGLYTEWIEAQGFASCNLEKKLRCRMPP